ncbi:histidine phosphatase family protein [Micrococcus luteus]|uniref:SixA phosphatase family protein n=1 Tax=Micrococcus luteus TaxID=1270 RepID=UPI0004E450CC|nr:histidine phosphatase [Micrococcus luteus]MCV7565331.1 histidine phosphatase family protein [Micrococcus luteus]MCV7574421.1 histidine phosphatase family protein [Micrococcus luteus]
MSTADAKTLIVLRHAKAGWPDAADDHARPLAERGHAQAPAAGDWLREHDLVPDAVVCSDALRTRQTCVWVCERLGELAPTPYLDPRLYGADAARALAIVNETEETTRRLLVVGHMPWVQELGMRLMSLDSDQDAALRMSEHYPTLGMQVFRVEKPWAELDGRDAALTHFVVPGR